MVMTSKKVIIVRQQQPTNSQQQQSSTTIIKLCLRSVCVIVDDKRDDSSGAKVNTGKILSYTSKELIVEKKVLGCSTAALISMYSILLSVPSNVPHELNLICTDEIFVSFLHFC